MSIEISSPTSAPRATWFTAPADFAARIPASVPLLLLRFALAIPFLRSGLTKWDGWRVADSTYYLFSEEFRLHLFGMELPYPAPGLMAVLSATGEVALPILLLAGLGTRFAAAGLLAMTLVIQLTVPDGWANFHLPWAAMALALLKSGAGAVSLDAMVARRLQMTRRSQNH